MVFGDLSTDDGLKVLNEFLSDKSYIEQFEASQADVVVFEAISKSIDAKKYPHLSRWYNHINSLKEHFNRY